MLSVNIGVFLKCFILCYTCNILFAFIAEHLGIRKGYLKWEGFLLGLFFNVIGFLIMRFIHFNHCIDDAHYMSKISEARVEKYLHSYK